MTIKIEVDLTPLVCCECSVDFALPARMVKKRREDHGWFYCPNGHPQHFVGPGPEEKLRRERDALAAKVARFERELVSERSRANAFKGHLARAKAANQEWTKR